MKLRQLTLLLCVLGAISMLHLWVLKQQNFDHGCWGFSGTSATSLDAGGCRDPKLQQADSLLGVPLTVWGYGLYFFVGTMAFAGVFASERVAQWAHLAAEAVLAAALPYCFYLVYFQFVVAKAYCPLCLLSDGLIFSLFTIHVIQHWRGFEEVPISNRGTELGCAAGILFGGTALMFALMLFVDRVGAGRLDQGDYTQFDAALARSLPKFIDVARLREMKPALFDDTVPRVESSEWISPDTPVLGNANGVKILAFLDPNCPHCRDTFAMLKSLGDRYRSQAGIYILPRVLWDFSLLQSLGLEVAGREGKYWAMWQLQFDRQKRGGLDMADIRSLFKELNVSADHLDERLKSVRPDVVALRSRATAAGINRTPTIFVNGRAVAITSMDERSIGKLIEAARSRESSGAALTQPTKTHSS